MLHLLETPGRRNTCISTTGVLWISNYRKPRIPRPYKNTRQLPCFPLPTPISTSDLKRSQAPTMSNKPKPPKSRARAPQVPLSPINVNDSEMTETGQLLHGKGDGSGIVDPPEAKDK